MGHWKENEKEWRKFKRFMGHHQGVNIHIKGFPEEKKEKVPENLFREIMAINFPTLKKEMDIQIQEVQETPIMK